MGFGKKRFLPRLLLASALFFALAACGDTPDETAPLLTMDPVTTPTALGSLSISGTVDADAAVEVKQEGTSLGAASRPEPGKWQADVSLKEGSNTVEVVATDPAGNTRLIRRTVVFDKTGPVLTSPAEGGSVVQSATLTLVFNEPVAQQTVAAILNGSPITLTKSTESASTFSGTPSPPLPLGEATLVLPAGIPDNLGNPSAEVTRKFTVSAPQ